MPRRRPTQLRPAATHRRSGPTPQVSHVSAGTLRAIADFERTRMHSGAVATALDRWAQYVRGPARRFYNDDHLPCPCPGCSGEDLAWERVTLRTALHALPTKAARELRARVRPLDEVYLARTVPSNETDHIRVWLRE